MERRTLLRLFAATAAGPLVLRAAEVVPDGTVQIGNLRETTVYDVIRDRFMTRLDILGVDKHGKLTQLGVDAIHSAKTLTDKDRAVALECLVREAEHDGIDLRKLLPLPDLEVGMRLK